MQGPNKFNGAGLRAPTGGANGAGPRRPGGLQRPVGQPPMRTGGGAPAGGAPKPGNTGIVPPRTGGGAPMARPAAPAAPRPGGNGISLPARNGFAQRNFSEGGKAKKAAPKPGKKK